MSNISIWLRYTLKFEKYCFKGWWGNKVGVPTSLDPSQSRATLQEARYMWGWLTFQFLHWKGLLQRLLKHYFSILLLRLRHHWATGSEERRHSAEVTAFTLTCHLHPAIIWQALALIHQSTTCLLKTGFISD